MSTLSHQRCFNHLAREAVARCPSCEQFFCRECVTEHEGRVICAGCLKKITSAPRKKGRTLSGALRLVQCGIGILVAWFFFYLLAESLLSAPSAFHEGTMWRAYWPGNE